MHCMGVLHSGCLSLRACVEVYVDIGYADVAVGRYTCNTSSGPALSYLTQFFHALFWVMQTSL